MGELQIGLKIKALRTQKKLSMRKLASLAGITPSMLSQIENELVNPSIPTLRAIAEALEVPLYLFFKEPSSNQKVVTPAQRMSIGKGSSSTGVFYELLTPDTNCSIEFCMMVIPPRTASNTHHQSHEGEEVAFLYSGEGVELELDGTTYYLRQGDSIQIPANTKHLWTNNTNSTVQVIFAVTPPSF